MLVTIAKYTYNITALNVASTTTKERKTAKQHNLDFISVRVK